MHLIRIFEAHGATAGAAGIASLVGNCSPRKALIESALRFRAISLGDLPFESFQISSIGESGRLFEQAFNIKLGTCDAFISHSWHDNPHVKWEALQQWRSDFIVKNRREPVVWFDKASIDQNNIEDDLRCLPIFLYGCKELVILCGTTYLSRLWCIVEIFTFVHMGGEVDRIRLVPLIRNGHEHEDEAAIREAFIHFDAEQCECFDANDKDRMLTIIYAAFGDMIGFNNAVRDIIEQAGFSIGHQALASSSSDGAGSEDNEKDSAACCCWA